MKPHENLDPLVIGGKSYRSRLLIGTGKYKDFAETRAAVEASGAEIVTVAIRRTNIGQDPQQPSLLEFLPPSKVTLLPNTAGCYTADDAVRTLRLAREPQRAHRVVRRVAAGGVRQQGDLRWREEFEQARLLRVLADIGAADRDRDDLGAARLHRRPRLREILVFAGADQQPRAVRLAADHQRVEIFMRFHS